MLIAVLIAVAADAVLASNTGPAGPALHRSVLPLVVRSVSVTSAAGVIAHLQDPAEFTVRVQDGTARPAAGVVMAFRVAGANAGSRGDCLPVDCRTGAGGVVTFRYTASALGTDTIAAEAVGFAVLGSAAVSWRPSVRGSRFVVLGDSYSAGEGVGDYRPDSDRSDVNRCHRSTAAYGDLVQHRDRFVSFTVRACSGAVSDDLFENNSGGNRLPDGTVEPAQLCVDCSDLLPAAIGPDTAAVALTIGGNDAGFTSVLASCVWVSELHLNYGRPGRGCSGQASIVGPVTARTAALGGTGSTTTPGGRPIRSMAEILARIHQLAPVAQVYILGYPRLFQPGDQDCFLGRIGVQYAGRTISVATKVTPADARWMDSVADELNRVAAAAAASAGAWAHFADPAAAFTGHGLCSGSAWINGVSGSLVVHSAQDVRAAIDSGSFHPTREGQEAFDRILQQSGL